MAYEYEEIEVEEEESGSEEEEVAIAAPKRRQKKWKASTMSRQLPRAMLAVLHDQVKVILILHYPLSCVATRILISQSVQ